MRLLRSAPLIVLSVACARLPVATAPMPQVQMVLVDSTFALPDSVLAPSSDFEYLKTRRILIPVAGATARQIQDSFDDPRDNGRRHRAIDILAPRGTPVLAADDGHILRMSNNALGGITIYAVDPDDRIVYYYAHLDHYHAGLTTGEYIQRGDTLGYVGTTGNAPKNTPHLHFQVMRMPYGGKQYWNGEPIDPYPLLVGGDQRR
jgi:peptidoglycan LD-endopeptidase LytH